MTLDLNDAAVKAAVDEAAKLAAKEMFDKEAGGLKAKNGELLEELKTFKQRFDGIDPDEFKKLKKAEVEGADKKSSPEELRKRIEDEFKPELTKAQQERDAARKELHDRVIDGELTNALAEVGVAKEFLRAVKADLQVSRKVEVVDGKALIDGKPAADFAKAWAVTDGKPFIAHDNSGGGGKGGGAGGAGGKKTKDMSLGEKTAFIKEHGDKAWKDKIQSES